MTPPINLLDCIARGFVPASEDLPRKPFYGWALSQLPDDTGEWDESAVHVSDYKYALYHEDGGCDRQLWHRMRGHDRREKNLYERIMHQQGHAMQTRFSWLIHRGLPDGWRVHVIEADISDGLPRDDIGSCDLVLAGPGVLMGVEMKTQRGGAFRYLDKLGAKDSHKMQAAGELYALRNLYPDREVLQRILYIDREGQNAARVYPVQWSEQTEQYVEFASSYVNRIKELQDGVPPVLEPNVRVRVNKGRNSIYLEEPWNCSYCDFNGPACPGAMPARLTERGIVAKGDPEGDYDVIVEKDADAIRGHIDRAAEAKNITYQ